MDLSIFIALAGVLSGFWFGFFGFGEFFLSFLLYLLSGLWQLKNKRSDGARLGLCFDLLCFVSSRLFFDAAVLDLIALFYSPFPPTVTATADHRFLVFAAAYSYHP